MMKGVALLAGCYIAGQLVGETLGQLMHINANVGGVGFAMLFLVLTQHWLHQRNRLTLEIESGILFWSRLYIPVIVAMAATQNVRVAVSSGLIALLAGAIPVVICLLLVPVLTKSIPNTASTTPDVWTT